MDEVHTLLLRHRHDALDVEIRGDRPLALADEIRLVRLEAMHAQPIFLRVDRDGAQPLFRSRAKNTDGDLAAIGNEKFFELFGSCT